MKKMKTNEWKSACVLLLICIVMAIAAPAETTFKTILNFNGTNGSAPPAALIQGPDGNLYGVTSFGGKNNAGTVFEVTTEGKLTTLYSFCSKANCADGAYPEASLVLATNGNFYGTTKFGGFDCTLSAVSPGCGTIFEITPEGKLTTLYTFCEKNGNCVDGANPEAPLIQGTNGDFYGTTFYGGNSNDAGTLFEFTTAGKLTTLHTFCSEAGPNCPDGSNPSGVIQAAEGDLYGATQTGGGSTVKGSPNCQGVSYRYGSSTGFSRGHALCTADDGAFFGSITQQGEALNQVVSNDTPEKSSTGILTFYGPTSGGGTHSSGVIFRLTSAATYSDIYNFCAQANCADGAYPSSGVVESTDGNFYGTTAGGGTGGSGVCVDLDGCGTVYMITPAGALTTLHQFDKTDGDDPIAGLVQATNGTFYGVTFYDGAGGNGTIFSISTGLGPFIQTVPTIGAVGTSVMILGTDLTGATSVTFNGKAADFKVVSATEITTTVPSGATTGAVEVTTPKGTLKSFAFTVQ
jgi:uncharacterized repeat protein (TIGR03803 family)